MKNIIYIYNASRAHKILPLLEGNNVFVFKSMTHLYAIRKIAANNAIVLIDSFGMFGIKGILVSMLFGVPLIVRLRGDFFRERQEIYEIRSSILAAPKLFIQLSLAHICILRSKAIIANSNYLRGVVLQRYPHKNIAVVYNPYTQKSPFELQSEANLPKSGYHLLSITNFNLVSKVEPLFVAMSEWLSESEWEKYDLYWVVCGSGPLASDFKKRIESLSYSKRIIYLGHVNSVDQYYQWSNLFIHLTKMDAFPNVTLEAMMHEIPVLTNEFSCGTLEQVCQGVNGMIVSGADEFTSAIDFYFSDKVSSRSHGQKGHQIVNEKFSVTAQLDRMKALIGKL